MSVTIEQVEKIASLAKLSFNEAEKQVFAHQFNQILSYVEKLNELDTEAVEPTFHVLEQVNVLRDDRAETWLTQEEVLANAPRSHHGFFSVPKVIG